MGEDYYGDGPTINRKPFKSLFGNLSRSISMSAVSYNLISEIIADDGVLIVIIPSLTYATSMFFEGSAPIMS